MRSRAEIAFALLLLAAAAPLRAGAAGGAGAAADARAAAPAPIGTYLSREEIRAAALKLQADPNLGGERAERTLRWVKAAAAEPAARPGWLQGLFEFLGQSSSLLLWIGGAAGVGIAAVWAMRVLRSRLAADAVAVPRAMQVQGLDIRPESLPGDIGATALTLLEAGRHREALSLLYRGALSRAVHRHGIAIGESFTEGEALRAVNARLDAQRAAYFSDLVRLWQRVVYAGEAVMREPVARLCKRFAAFLEGAPG